MIDDLINRIKQAYHDLEQSEQRRVRMSNINMEFGVGDPNVGQAPPQPVQQQAPQPPTVLDLLTKGR